MNSLAVKATAAVTVLAATAAFAAGSYIPTGFLSSPPFLWVAANVIIIWLLSSSRRRDNSSSSADTYSSSGNDVLNAVDDLYPSSDYEGYSSATAAAPRSREAPPRPVAVVSKPIKRQQPREPPAARAANNNRRTTTDRARVLLPPKKPVAGEATRDYATVETRSRLDDDAGEGKKRGGVDEKPARTVAAVEASKPDKEGEEDVSMDSLWQSMVQRRAVRPVSVRKSETWGNEEMPRLQRAAETAAARRREMRKSASSALAPAPPQPSQPQRAEAAAAPVASAVRQLGWRTRDVLVKAQDDLLRRAESLIRRHHEQLRLQRQESEQRQAMERQQRGRPPPALIRV